MSQVGHSACDDASLSSLGQASAMYQRRSGASTGTQVAASTMLNLRQLAAPSVTPNAKLERPGDQPMQICMRMTTSDTSWKWHCHKFVKEDLFKKVKFWDTVNYSAFSTAPNSVSGMFISRFTFDSGTETQKWWRTSVCPFLISMLGDHCNNAVKSIHKKRIFVGAECTCISQN